MPKLLVAEAALLVLCSAITVALVVGIVWLVRRRKRRGRRGRAVWSVVALRRWVTPRRLALAVGGLLLLAATAWWVADHWQSEAPLTDDYELVINTGGAEGAELIEIDAGLDPAARERLLSERWRRGLPLLAAIALVVIGWVALAHSGILDQRQRGRTAATARAKN